MLSGYLSELYFLAMSICLVDKTLMAKKVLVFLLPQVIAFLA